MTTNLFMLCFLSLLLWSFKAEGIPLGDESNTLLESKHAEVGAFQYLDVLRSRKLMTTRTVVTSMGSGKVVEENVDVSVHDDKEKYSDANHAMDLVVMDYTGANKKSPIHN